MLEAEKLGPAAHLVATQFKPGGPKLPNSGRKKGSINRDRALSIDRIVKLADPVGRLCAIACGKPVHAAPIPGAKAEMITPTLADQLTALRILSDKVLPDLKAVEFNGGGQLVHVHLQLGQKVELR